MSGIIKGIGKVFKSVVKVVKKIAIPALVIGAIVLTGGAAIGALPALGTMIGGLGLSAGVTAALTTAVSSAAIGGAVGGLTAAATGKNIIKGMSTGGAIGFVTGGIGSATGLLGSAGGAAGGTAGTTSSTGLTGLLSQGNAVVGGAIPIPGAVASAVAPAAGSTAGTILSSLPASIPTAAANAASLAGLAPIQTVASGGGGLLGAAGNALGGITKAVGQPGVLGPIIQGIGGGIQQHEATKDAEKARQAEIDRIKGNYSGGLGLLGSYGGQGNTMLPTPTQKFDPAAYGGQYQYVPGKGVVYVPNAPRA